MSIRIYICIDAIDRLSRSLDQLKERYKNPTLQQSQMKQVLEATVLEAEDQPDTAYAQCEAMEDVNDLKST